MVSKILKYRMAWNLLIIFEKWGFNVNFKIIVYRFMNDFASGKMLNDTNSE